MILIFFLIVTQHQNCFVRTRPIRNIWWALLLAIEEFKFSIYLNINICTSSCIFPNFYFGALKSSSHPNPTKMVQSAGLFNFWKWFLEYVFGIHLNFELKFVYQYNYKPQAHIHGYTHRLSSWFNYIFIKIRGHEWKI